jgi:pimeloyl-ACP methyl ester carboxylesterase
MTALQSRSASLFSVAVACRRLSVTRGENAVKPRRLYIDGPFGQIHVQRLGSGPAILLNHQSSSSSGAFEAVYPLFADAGFTAVGVDSPGMGASDAQDAERWSLDMFADASAAVVEALGLGRVVSAGHHTGAGTALRHAMRHPGQVRGLAMHQLLLYDAATRAHFATNPIPPMLPQRDGSHLLAGWQAREGAAGPWTDLTAMNRGVLDLLRAGPLVARSFAAALAYDAEPDLLAVRCPGLILTNTGDHNHACALHAHKMRPDFAYAELEGGAIDIMDEQPREWADAIIAFVRGLPE